jgi:hypothetical protein
MIVGAVRDLYIARWGEPSRKAAFGVAGLEVEVCKWNAEANPEGSPFTPRSDQVPIRWQRMTPSTAWSTSWGCLASGFS